MSDPLLDLADDLDPSRCAEEGCLAEGTEPMEFNHWDGPQYFCKAHFAERAERTADLLTRGHRHRRDG